MRYLKVFAQDRTGSGRADTVLLQFYESLPLHQDRLLHHAVAYDYPVDGKIDYSRGDVNNDGEENCLDQLLLDQFATAYLKLNWFNSGTTSIRHLKIHAECFYDDGVPNVVRLDFHEYVNTYSKNTLVYHAAAYDADGNGVFETVTDSDMDGNGVVDKVDKALIRCLCTSYLAFNW